MERTKGFGVIAVTMIFSLAGAALSAYAYAGQTTRVSVSSNGFAANLGATNGVLSADGRYVVFQSSSTNLVPDTTGIQQVFRHDRTTGATALVSVATTGLPGNNVSRDPSVSRDGRYVVFSSFATDLTASDANNGIADVLRRDMQTGTTKLVSANAAGVQADMGSGLSGLAGAHAISDNGRFVAFTSIATNLVAATNNGRQQVYVKDMDTDEVVRASVNDAGLAGDQSSEKPVISGDGRVVAFNSTSTNFSALSTTGFAQVFVHDLGSHTTSLESVATSGLPHPGRHSTGPALSFDGRYVAFESQGVLDTRDLDNGLLDVYLRDRVAPGSTVLASLSNNVFSFGGPNSARASISGDGRWVGFDSLDDRLVTGDVGGLTDVFVYDRDTQAIVLASRNDAGDQANQGSFGPSLSSDGHLVLFGSTATNLVGSAAAGNQLYVRNLVANLPPVIPVFGRDFPLFEGQSMRLLWEFTDNDASTSWTATVDWGDGAGQQGLALDGKRFFLQHMWAPGTYDLTVEITDDGGLTGSLVIHVVVTNTNPSVGTRPAPDLAFTRTFDTTGLFSDPGSEFGETYSATVNYGDGSGVQPLALDAGSFALHHTYAAAGTYTVTVRVTDSSGGTGTATTVVNVGAYSYEWLDPLGTSFTVGRNLPVKFRVLGPDGAAVFDRSVQVDVVNLSGDVVVGPYVFGGQPSRAVTWSGDSYHVNVDTKVLEAGMYWLRVRFSSTTLSGEFSLATNATSSAVRSRLRD